MELHRWVLWASSLLLAASTVNIADATQCTMSPTAKKHPGCSIVFDVNCSNKDLQSVRVPCIHQLRCHNCHSKNLQVEKPSIKYVQVVNLTQLELEEQIPNAFGWLHALKLTYIHITRSPSFTSLEKGFFANLSDVHTIDVRHNAIEEIKPGTFAGTKHVHSILVGSNPLSKLAAGSFKGLSSVKHLSLKHAKDLTTLRKGVFKGLSDVKKLEITDVPLKTIEKGAFRGLEMITELVIEATDLTELPDDVFSGMTQGPKILSLAHNQLLTISPHALRSLFSLTELDLSGNPFHHMKGDVLLGDLPELTTVKLDNNRLKCDCKSFLWLVKFTNKTSSGRWEEELEDTQCVGPTGEFEPITKSKYVFENCRDEGKSSEKGEYVVLNDEKSASSSPKQGLVAGAGVGGGGYSGDDGHTGSVGPIAASAYLISLLTSCALLVQ